MSMDCMGCEHNTNNEKRQSFCAYFKETKLDMDRDVTIKYIAFKNGFCHYDTRKEEDGREE